MSTSNFDRLSPERAAAVTAHPAADPAVPHGVAVAAPEMAAQPPAHPQGGRWAWLLGLVVFGLLAALLTWPRLANAATSVVDPGDPLEDVWTLRWIDQALLTAPTRLYAAPIFHGFPLPLAYDDTSLGPALLALPLTALTGSIVLTYNLLLVASYALAGWSAFLLARHVTRSTGAGIVAGMVYGFWSYTFAHISHLSVLSLYPIPFALLCLHKAFDAADRASSPDLPPAARRIPPALLWLLGFAAFFVWQALHSFYYVAYLGLAAAALIGWEAVVVRRWRRWTARARLSIAGGLLVAGLIGGLALAVLSIPYRDVQREFGFYRSAEEQTAWAAHPADFLGVSPRNRTYRYLLPNVWPEPLFPGFAVLALGTLGLGVLLRFWLLAFGVWSRFSSTPNPTASSPAPKSQKPKAKSQNGARAWPMFYALLAAGGVILALGPTLDLGTVQVPLPYSVLATLPGFSGLRSPVRLIVLAALGWGVLAGWGWQTILTRLGGDRPARRGGWVAVPATLLLLGVLCAEQWNVLTPTTPLPNKGTPTAAYRWLADHPDGGVLAEFPILIGLRDPTRATTLMFAQGSHGHPLLNGYSSFIPPTYAEIARQLDHDVTITPQDLGILQSLDVRYLRLDRIAYKKSHWRQLMADLGGYPEAHLIGNYGDEFNGEALFGLDALPAAARLRLSGTLPARLPPGATVPLTVTITNVYSYPLLTRLQPRLALEAAWMQAGDANPSAWPLRCEVAAPLVLPPGSHTFTTTLPAPPAGRYTLYLRPIDPAPAYQPITPLPPVAAP